MNWCTNTVRSETSRAGSDMRWGTAAAVAAAVGAGAAVLVIGRRASERMVHPASAVQESGPVRVQSLAAGRVTFTRSPESLRPGRWAVEWDDHGHAVVEDVLHSDEHGVTRRLVRADRGALVPGTEVRFTPASISATPPRRSASRSPTPPPTANSAPSPPGAWTASAVSG